MYYDILSTDIRGLCYKSFTIVTYNHYYIDLYYKTTIPANLALASSANYDHEVFFKPMHTLLSYFTIVNFDCKTITAQATSLRITKGDIASTLC